jgi:hypothetical protein
MPWGYAAAAVVGAVASSDASKRASRATTNAANTASDQTTRSAQQARGDLFDIFPQAQRTGQQGFQSALDVFGQSLPAQTDVFQQGNIGAQQAILAGLPQIQNALLGGNVDFSQLQPTQVQTPDLGFFQQTLPQIQQQQQLAAMNSGLGPYTDENQAFNGMMGPFESAGGAGLNQSLPAIRNNAFDTTISAADRVLQGFTGAMQGNTPQQAKPANFNTGADTNTFNKDRFRFGR